MPQGSDPPPNFHFCFLCVGSIHEQTFFLMVTRWLPTHASSPLTFKPLHGKTRASPPKSQNRISLAQRGPGLAHRPIPEPGTVFNVVFTSSGCCSKLSQTHRCVVILQVCLSQTGMSCSDWVVQRHKLGPGAPPKAQSVWGEAVPQGDGVRRGQPQPASTTENQGHSQTISLDLLSDFLLEWADVFEPLSTCNG